MEDGKQDTTNLSEEGSVSNIRSDHIAAVKEEFIAHTKEKVHGESRDANE